MNPKSSKKTRLMSLVTGITFADIVVGLMLAVVVGIMPLIARVAFRPFSPELIPLYHSGHYYVDVFGYWKGWLVIVPAIVIVFFSICDWAIRRCTLDLKVFLKRPPVFISLVYLVLVIISALASPYTHTSWFGMIHRSEGAFMWLAYFTLFFATMYFVRETRHARFILYALFFSSAIISIIGVGQFMGRNFFNTELARWLVTAGTSAKGIRPAFEYAHGTSIHHNTFGKYSAMLSPILLFGALAYDGKKMVNLLSLVVGGLMLLCVFGSKSLGGLIGIITATGILAGVYICGILYKKQKGSEPRFFDKRLALMTGGVALILVLLILFITPINNRVALLFNRLGDAMRSKTHPVENYFFQGDTMTMYWGADRQFSLTVHSMSTDEWLTVRDGKGQEVPYLQETSPEKADFLRYVFEVPGYGNITIDRYPKHFSYFCPRLRRPLFMTLQDEHIFGISLNGDLIDLAKDIPAWGFHGRETWGTLRGYIWSRSFPLFPSRVFIGSGPDTFATAFPQQDLVGKIRFFHNPYVVVDLTQNLFIRTWITTGGISAIALFALFGHYILSTFLSLVKTKGEPTFSYRLRLGFLAGISAFCMSSMSTDSTIGSTGVFFVLLGLGYGLNTIAQSNSPE